MTCRVGCSSQAKDGRPGKLMEGSTVALTNSSSGGFLSLPQSDWAWSCEVQGSSLGELGRGDSPSEGPMVLRDSQRRLLLPIS